MFVGCEGTVSEVQYLRILNHDQTAVLVKPMRRKNDGAPKRLLADMRRWLREEQPRANDQAWLVVDTDSWPEEHLHALHQWTAENASHHLAVSNPAFELWLLLHFEDGHGIATPAECRRRLERHLPGYDKSVNARAFPRERVAAACERARVRDTPACCDWPRNPPGTTVYRLVDAVMAEPTTSPTK